MKVGRRVNLVGRGGDSCGGAIRPLQSIILEHNQDKLNKLWVLRRCNVEYIRWTGTNERSRAPGRYGETGGGLKVARMGAAVLAARLPPPPSFCTIENTALFFGESRPDNRSYLPRPRQMHPQEPLTEERPLPASRSRTSGG